MAKDPIKIGLEKAGQRIVDRMVDTLFENRSVISGNLARSLGYEVEENSKGGYSLFITDDSGQGRGGYNYGLSVDQGLERKPGKQPPVQPIIEWLKLRSISIPSGFTTQSFAFVIARSIGKKGQRFRQPKPFIQPSVDFVLNSYLPAELEEQGALVIEQLLDKIAK